MKKITMSKISGFFVMSAVTLIFASITHAANSIVVAPETFIRAETDRMFQDLSKQAGGLNKFFHFRSVTPLDKQTVIRMNKDTLYSMAVVDTEGGATITVPEIPKGRYASVYLVDNDHYVPFVIYESGTHKLPNDTKYLGLGIRIQVFDPKDEDELKLVNNLQDKFIIKANSADPLPAFKWDSKSLDKLREQYEKDSAKYSSWKGMQGPRGKVDENTRHFAAAAVWGLFPEWDADYLNYNGGHDYKVCHSATYPVPDNDAFWSITIYGNDGYMKHENGIINASNVQFNDDGTFTVYYGSKEACGDVPNRLDVTEGWNFLMRVYRPGQSVIDGKYKMPEVNPVSETQAKTHYHTPADFGVSDVAYKVSETDFNMKRSLAKASVNKWAHQSDVSSVKTQQVIRENQDVIYSSAVVDISKGATFTVPNSDTYHTIEIIDMQNYIVGVLYPGEDITVTPDNVTYGNYVYLLMRIRKLPDSKGGLKETLKLQGLANIKAISSVPYKTPDIVVSEDKMIEIRTALIQDVKEGKLPDTSMAIGTPYNTNTQDQLYGTAYGWGGLGIEDAAYQPITNKSKNDNGKSLPSSITFTPPEIDYERGGFWSITTYNEEGWLAKDIAAISNTEAEVNGDGSYTIHFNSPNEKNNVDTPSPFSALLRIYVPKSKVGIISYLRKANVEMIIK
ncbi:MAG: DUF1214 domain-containing protein [Campylobacterota bacterium]|nr:DUF1214 domain-containing protein [Campylobacterota bacterium]